ncbi:MAG: HXXEE domain-containing protein [Sphingomonas sp.]|jgi:hypothetical protein|nr:HXXEE domain-containing protein [Sphingomonas sp.]
MSGPMGRSLYRWLASHWVSGAAMMATALLLLLPLLIPGWPLPLLLIFLHGPGYMLHQVEEHAGDRFRRYINQVVLGGREGLTTLDVLWINLAGVWGVNLLALYVAAWVGPGWGLIAPYLMLVNALSHLGAAARHRAYNPGVGTSAALFLPLALASLMLIPATPAQHALGLAVAVAAHGLIIANLLRRLRALRVAEVQAATGSDAISITKRQRPSAPINRQR